MGNIYDTINVGGVSDRTPLAPGKYDDLRVAKYLGSKATKTVGLDRHSFLVASESVEGTAFLSMNIDENWRSDDAISVAFKIDTIGTADGRTAFKDSLEEAVAEKVVEANTPDDQAEEAIAKGVESALKQIQISLGTVFRLQDYAGVPRDPKANLSSLENVIFTGRIERSNIGDTSEVKAVYPKKKKKEEPKDDKPPF